MSDSADSYIPADTTVRGRVTTAEGEVLEGVTVSVKGITSSLIFVKNLGGPSPTLQIRGISTLSTDTNTSRILIVLDDFPYDGDIIILILI